MIRMNTDPFHAAPPATAEDPAPSSGSKPGARRSALMALLIAFPAGAVIWAGLWAMQSRLAGHAPAQKLERSLQDQANPHGASSPAFDTIRAEAAESPKDLQRQLALASALLDRVQNSPEADLQTALEAIESFQSVLKLDPQNSFALLSMGDISFHMQVFEKATAFYQEYLKLKPDDQATRTRYANALTFINKPEQAIAELKRVLAALPNDFHALAYLAIAHSQAGDDKSAAQIGRRAIATAPDEEAKRKFEGFLASLEEEGSGK